MKKTINILMLALLASLSLQAVADDYLPLVREGVRWHYGYYDDVEGVDPDGVYDTKCYYEFKGDSIINGNVYKKLYCTVTKGDFGLPKLFAGPKPITFLECCMMEKDKVVYAIDKFEEHNYLPCMETELGNKLYDFNRPAQQITDQFSIQGVKCSEFEVELSCYDYYYGKMPLIEGFGYKCVLNDYNSTLPDPYKSRCTCPKGWYFIKFTDTEDNILFDPEKPIVNGVNDVKVEAAKADGGYYNLQGQAVDIKTAPAGIYIHNGKKVTIQ